MINTAWNAKIDAQQLFYFILPVGGNFIDLAVSMKARLKLYADAHGTLIFDKWSPKNHEKTHRVEVGYFFCYNMKLQMLLFRREVIMKTRLSGSFQHLYPVAAWMNKLL